MTARIKISAPALSALAAVFMALACNAPLWAFIMQQQGAWFALRCVILLAAFYGFVLGLFAWPRVQKPLIGALLLLSVGASYFIFKYGIYIDSGMIRSALETDRAEAGDLAGWSFAVWMGAFFVLPAALLWRAEVSYARRLKTVLLYARMPALCAFLLLGVLWGNMQELAPFYRNHREVRHMAVPYNVIAAGVKYIRTDVLPVSAQKPHVAAPAVRRARPAEAPRRVVVLVVGETARAANFSLGGYGRLTNPALAQRQDILYFSAFSACGTYTAYSLPCMFSSLRQKDFSPEKFGQHDHLAALAVNAGMTAVWIDNNSGCKGVCGGMEVIRDKDLAKSYPKYCPEGECFDGVFAEALKQTLQREGDLFIVLHQKGSHGPLYYKRVPAEFARFQPSCLSADLAKCTQAEIINAYDNTILYTDHVLDSLVDVLAQEPAAALFYASDHGESLGEKGMYLHGAPYILAPSEQTHIPAMMWLSEGMAQAQGLDRGCLQRKADAPFSHDNVFSTVLGLSDIDTPALQPDLDILNGCRKSRMTGLSARGFAR